MRRQLALLAQSELDAVDLRRMLQVETLSQHPGPVACRGHARLHPCRLRQFSRRCGNATEWNRLAVSLFILSKFIAANSFASANPCIAGRGEEIQNGFAISFSEMSFAISSCSANTTGELAIVLLTPNLAVVLRVDHRQESLLLSTVHRTTRPSSSAQFCTMTIGKSSLFSTIRNRRPSDATSSR